MEGTLTAPGLEARFTLRRGESFRLDMALSFPPGQTVALLGPNGAGKSTVVAALAGLLPIDTGTITLVDATSTTPHTNLRPRRSPKVGVVFQDYLLFPHLSVIENVAFGLRSRGVRRDAMTRAANWLERLGLTDQARSKPGTFPAARRSELHWPERW